MKTLTKLLKDRKQRIVLNGHYSSWTSVEAVKDFILGPLLFLFYINDLSDNLLANPKLVGDNSFLFSVFQDLPAPSSDVNNDLNKVKNIRLSMENKLYFWSFKQAQEVIFYSEALDSPLLFKNRFLKKLLSKSTLVCLWFYVIHSKTSQIFHKKLKNCCSTV